MKKLFVLLVLFPAVVFGQVTTKQGDNVSITSEATMTIQTKDEGDLKLVSDQDGDAHEVYLDGTTGDLVSDGHLDFETTGKTIILEDGTAASTCIGTATANGTTAVTTSTTCAQTGDYIFISAAGADVNTANCWATNIVDATSFDLDCDAASTTVFNWFIVKGQ